MKRIEAIIRPTRVGKVCIALEKAGYPGINFTQIESHVMQEGARYELRCKAYNVDLAFRARVEVIVKDTEAAKIVKTVRDAAFTGGSGDGDIYIHAMEDVIKVSTGKSGDTGI